MRWFYNERFALEGEQGIGQRIQGRLVRGRAAASTVRGLTLCDRQSLAQVVGVVAFRDPIEGPTDVSALARNGMASHAHGAKYSGAPSRAVKSGAGPVRARSRSGSAGNPLVSMRPTPSRKADDVRLILGGFSSPTSAWIEHRVLDHLATPREEALWVFEEGRDPGRATALDDLGQLRARSSRHAEEGVAAHAVVAVPDEMPADDAGSCRLLVRPLGQLSEGVECGRRKVKPHRAVPPKKKVFAAIC